MPSNRTTRDRPSRLWRAKADASLLLGFALWVVRLLRRPLEACGVHFGPFCELLRVRFTVATRTGPGADLVGPNATSAGGAGMREMLLVLVLMLFWFVGLLSGIGGLLAKDPLIAVALPQAAFMGLLAFVLLGQYVDTLVDPADLGVFAHHPVSDTTLYAARLADLFFHAGLCALAFIVGAMMLAPFGAHPVARTLMTPVIVLLATVTTVGLIALFFAVVLRAFGPKRYQRITLWVQITLMTVMMGGGQFSNPVIRSAGSLSDFARPELGLLVPPIHLMGLFQVATGEFSGLNLALSALAVSLPALALWLTLRLASRYFAAGLSGTLELTGAAPDASPQPSWTRGYVPRQGARWCRDQQERAGFDFATAMATREPTYLRGALPVMIGMQVMGFGMALNGAIEALPWLYAMSVAMPPSLILFVVPTAFEAAMFSKHAEGRWALLTAPTQHRDALVRGSLKGLCLGAIGLTSICSVTLLTLALGPSVLPRIALSMGLAVAAALHFASRWHMGIPFTRPAGHAGSSARNIPLTFAVAFVSACLVVAEIALFMHPLGIALGLLAVPPLVWSQVKRMDGVVSREALARI